MNTTVRGRAKRLGLKIHDAKRPLRIEVTAKDIRGATMKDPQSCGFARACQRTQPINAAYFFKTTAWLEYDDKVVKYALPSSMQKEIVAFDRNKTMAPGVYQLSPLTKSQTQAGMKKYNETKGERKQLGTGKPKPFRHQTEGLRASRLGA